MKRLKAVTSIAELARLAAENPSYHRLAMTAASNLGGRELTNLGSAIYWLNLNATETSEAGVVNEINAVRKFLKV